MSSVTRTKWFQIVQESHTSKQTRQLVIDMIVDNAAIDEYLNAMLNK